MKSSDDDEKRAHAVRPYVSSWDGATGSVARLYSSLILITMQFFTFPFRLRLTRIEQRCYSNVKKWCISGFMEA